MAGHGVAPPATAAAGRADPETGRGVGAVAPPAGRDPPSSPARLRLPRSRGRARRRRAERPRRRRARGTARGTGARPSPRTRRVRSRRPRRRSRRARTSLTRGTARGARRPERQVAQTHRGPEVEHVSGQPDGEWREQQPQDDERGEPGAGDGDAERGQEPPERTAGATRLVRSRHETTPPSARSSRPRRHDRSCSPWASRSARTGTDVHDRHRATSPRAATGLPAAPGHVLGAARSSSRYGVR